MRHKRATDYGGRIRRGFWIESAFIALIAWPFETRNAGCEAEAQLDQRTKQRLQVLVDTGSLELTLIACSCPPGTEATQRCNHRRRCGILRAEDRDVGSVLMSEWLAIPFQSGKASCLPTPRPWCR